MTKTPVEAAWESFATTTLSDGPDDPVLNDIRFAFYSGIACAMDLILEHSRDTLGEEARSRAHEAFEDVQRDWTLDHQTHRQ